MPDKAEIMKWYLDHKGVRCPFCHSDDIQCSTIGADGNTAKAFVSCDSCNKHWTDVYELVDIEFIDEKED